MYTADCRNAGDFSRRNRFSRSGSPRGTGRDQDLHRRREIPDGDRGKHRKRRTQRESSFCQRPSHVCIPRPARQRPARRFQEHRPSRLLPVPDLGDRIGGAVDRGRRLRQPLRGTLSAQDNPCDRQRDRSIRFTRDRDVDFRPVLSHRFYKQTRSCQFCNRTRRILLRRRRFRTYLLLIDPTEKILNQI